MLKVQILVDGKVRKRRLMAEHGLALWIEKDDKRILYHNFMILYFINVTGEQDYE